MKKTLRTCRRGHTYYKSSDCPVCPECWAGYYKNKLKDDFGTLGAPARRALHNAKITSLKQLSRFSQDQVLELHGMGPKAIKQLKVSLRKKKLSFR